MIWVVRVVKGRINGLLIEDDKMVSGRMGFGFPSPRRADMWGDDAKYMLHLEARDKRSGRRMLCVCQLTIV